MASRQLSFINISHPEESHTRHNVLSVRRHVMAVVGRSKRKKARYRIIPLKVVTMENAPGAKSVMAATESAPLGRMPPSFQTHLVDTNTRACELISFMTAEADYVYRPFRTSWVQIGLSDATAFDLWLAQAIMIRDGVVHDEYNQEYLSNFEANKYYSKSLSQLSRRLSNREECVSSGVIATIMGFICIDTRVGNWDRYSLHMSGLERIFYLRNGFDGLTAEIPLMAFFLDLMGASMLDRYPRFPIPKHLNNHSQDDIPDALNTLLESAERMTPQGKRICAMLRATASVITLANRNANDALFWTQDAIVVENLGRASHHILSVPKSLEDDPHTVYPVFIVQRMVQLSCLMVISKLKQLAAFHWAEMDSLGARLVNLLQEPCDEIPVHLRQLRLWAITTACSLANPETQSLYLVELRQAIKELGYRTAEEAMSYVRGLLWLEGIDMISVDKLDGCCND